MTPDVTANLLWRPLLSKQLADDFEIRIRVMPIAPGAAAAGPGSSLSFAGPIGAVNVRAAVAFQFPIYRGKVTPKLFGNFSDRQALLSQCGKHYPLFVGELYISHGNFNFLAGVKVLVLQLTFLLQGSVALSL